jgi:hypothetical protein
VPTPSIRRQTHTTPSTATTYVPKTKNTNPCQFDENTAKSAIMAEIPSTPPRTLRVNFPFQIPFFTRLLVCSSTAYGDPHYHYNTRIPHPQKHTRNQKQKKRAKKVKNCRKTTKKLKK